VKRDRGTFRPIRDADRIEFTSLAAVPGSMPQKPDWLTAAGEVVWLDNVTRCVPPLTESDSTHFAIYCNLIGAIGQAYAVGDIPPIAAQAEARRMGELFGMVGAQSRVGSKAAIRTRLKAAVKVSDIMKT
jgi:hypothetical protein